MTLDLTEYRQELERIFARHNVILAYLFGSQAEGKSGPLSDVDIAVLLGPQVAKERWTNVQIDLINDLIDLFHRDDVEVALLNRATPVLAQEVVRSGQVIYEAEPATRVDFQVATLRRYVDTGPLRRLQNRCLLERIGTFASSGAPGKMIKVDAIMERLRALDEYIRILQPYRNCDLGKLVEDRLVYGGVLHYLQLSVQVVMDISSHLHAELELERANNYKEVIITLGKHRILPPEFAERFSGIIGFRNVLVHDYLTVDPLRVQDVLQNGITDLQAFMVHITDFLRQEGYLTQ